MAESTRSATGRTCKRGEAPSGLGMEKPRPKRHPRAHLHARTPSAIAGPSAVLLDDVAMESAYGISRFTWRAWRNSGRGPAVVKLGRLIRYRRADAEKWVAENVVEARDLAASRKATTTDKAAAR